jgi:hypothetical protein
MHKVPDAGRAHMVPFIYMRVGLAGIIVAVTSAAVTAPRRPAARPM